MRPPPAFAIFPAAAQTHSLFASGMRQTVECVKYVYFCHLCLIVSCVLHFYYVFHVFSSGCIIKVSTFGFRSQLVNVSISSRRGALLVRQISQTRNVPVSLRYIRNRVAKDTFAADSVGERLRGAKAGPQSGLVWAGRRQAYAPCQKHSRVQRLIAKAGVTRQRARCRPGKNRWA